ncbi:hypothetical protein AL755_15875 [Arthrobacter sp. ERGS1:01]|uniref:hypothetical protein n=1 Tax=Arthrobacter sp. ERGS1:01 TaxID=1704044 RepID=UPI0006B43B09|nr:hypothetical protein [Arthrobacter sp. ERGS1:01]ALE06592.1 hypothetical protein AL755_15875 [Arthrobacter sp. ERGS1:01]
MNRLLVLLLVATAVAYSVASVVSWVARKRTPRSVKAGTPTGPPSNAAVGRAMLTAQLPGMVSAIFAVILFIALLRPSVAVAGRVGLPLALSAGACVTAGLLLFSALPPARPYATATASASTVPPTVPPAKSSLRRRWTLALPLLVLAANLAVFVTAGLTSATDSQGGYRLLRLADATRSAAASPYPGWSYGVPLMLVMLALAASMLLALRRIATAPSLPDPRMAGLDRRWREISTRIVARLVTGALLAYLGGTAFMAGLAMVNGAASGGSATSPAQPLFALGIAAIVAGVAVVLAGVVGLVLAARDALTIRGAVRGGTA